MLWRLGARATRLSVLGLALLAFATGLYFDAAAVARGQMRAAAAAGPASADAGPAASADAGPAASSAALPSPPDPAQERADAVASRRLAQHATGAAAKLVWYGCAACSFR